MVRRGSCAVVQSHESNLSRCRGEPLHEVLNGLCTAMTTADRSYTDKLFVKVLVSVVVRIITVISLKEKGVGISARVIPQRQVPSSPLSR